MKKPGNFFISFLNALGVLIYISMIALLLSNGENVFGKVDNFLIPIFMLLLFVVSALITGLLVLGRPIHLYLGGFKKEALIMLFSTLVWMVLFILIVIVVALLV